jgi:hypothetical protein
VIAIGKSLRTFEKPTVGAILTAITRAARQSKVRVLLLSRHLCNHLKALVDQRALGIRQRVLSQLHHRHQRPTACRMACLLTRCFRLKLRKATAGTFSPAARKKPSSQSLL